MRKIIFLMIVLGAFVIENLCAQTVSGFKLADIKTEYVEAAVTQFSKTAWINLDFGQRVSDNFVRTEDGKKLEYSSGIEFVNKMAAQGYVLFQAYTTPSGQKIYILKRK
ncbi:hypothetical protein ACJVDH_00510 [Pedobacter sp. AW1-32]|uniref:hypothetical protein n=1 Tax=Pedobacter sp. AW1-32 TaxID=3383026 RepID=UPI003FEFEAAE